MPTLNLTTGSNLDDGYIQDPSTYSVLAPTIFVGVSGGNDISAWYRFPGVSGLSGATIDSAVVEIEPALNHSPLAVTTIKAETVAAPTFPASYADYIAKAKTTASVAWSIPGPVIQGIPEASPDISTVIQELADSLDPTAIQIFHLEDASSAVFFIIPHDLGGSVSSPKLDIDYTEAHISPPRIDDGSVSIGAGNDDSVSIGEAVDDSVSIRETDDATV